jgi:4-amino-4-deoxychorismate lyase
LTHTTSQWWVDGIPAAPVPTDDRALNYGDGLFETMAVVAGQVRLLDYHLDRLLNGCRRLAIACDRASIERTLRARAEALGNGVLKLLLSRGSAARGYRAPPEVTPRCIISVTPREAGFAVLRDTPIRVRTCVTPVSINPALAGIKHLNRLEQVLARSEWQDESIAEGLMLDDAGRVVCATAANVFAVLEGVLVTPSLQRAGVAGVMRRAVLESAQDLGLSVRIAELPFERLPDATELMLSSALTGLRSVDRLDENVLAQHKLADRLRARLAERLAHDHTPGTRP